MIFDLFCLIILIIFFVGGIRRGFFSSIVSLLGTIFVFYLSIPISKEILNLLNSNTVLINKINFFLTGILEKMNLSVDIGENSSAVLKYIFQMFGVTELSVQQLIIQVILYLMIVFTLRLIFKLVLKIFNFIFKNSFLSLPNRLLGGAFGMVKGIVCCAMIFLIISFVLTLKKDGAILNLISNSYCYELLKNGIALIS